MSDNKDDSEVIESSMLSADQVKQLEAEGKLGGEKEDIDEETVKKFEAEVHKKDVEEAFDRPLTDEQKQMLADLTGMFNEEQKKSKLFTPIVLERFLRARKFDVKAAHKMFSDMLEFRAKNWVDWVMQNEPHGVKVYQQFFADTTHKYDKHGWPVYMCRMGSGYYYEMSQRLTVDSFMFAHYYIMESLTQKCVEAKAVAPRWACIVDFAGLGMHARYYLEYFKPMTECDERNWPEILGVTYSINAPKIFSFFWNIAKGWLDPYTAAKMRLFGHGYEKSLCDFMGEDVIPKEYGGKCDCPGGCLKKLPVIDWREFDDKVRKEADRTFELDTINVAAGKSYEITMDIAPKELEKVGTADKPGKGVRVNWFSELEARTLNFSVEFQPSKRKVDQSLFLEHPRKLHPQIPLRGQTIVFEPGKLIFKWDNTFSYFRSKTVKLGVRRGH